MDNILLRLEEVSKFYKDGDVQAIRGISLEVKKGEFFLIRGPSGSGKSTLLHLIGGLDKPDGGKIYFEGADLKALARRRFFRITTFGFVFQAFYLWPTLNVLENVLLPLMELPGTEFDKKKRAKSLIQSMGLTHRELSNVNRLSMGERQRVAIARALVTQPKVLLADEPTGSLDSKNAQHILQLFKAINKENSVTVIMASHSSLSPDIFTCGVELLDGKVRTGF